MITRIKIDGFKSFQGMEVNLQPLSVIFGPNASGKSNFLEAIQLVSRIVTFGGIFEAGKNLYDSVTDSLRGKITEIFSHHFNHEDKLSLSIEVDVELSDSALISATEFIKVFNLTTETEPVVLERFYRYRFNLEYSEKDFGTLDISSEFLSALNGEGNLKGEPLFDSPNSIKNFYNILSFQNLKENKANIHAVALQFELSGWQHFNLNALDKMRIGGEVRKVDKIGEGGENLIAFLNVLKHQEPDQFRNLELALKTLIPRIEGIQIEVNRGDLELHLIENGHAISSRVISDGTLRLLALLAVCGSKNPPSLITLEEPENGVHPGRLELIARFLEAQTALGKTQFIVTTHSPFLPDFLPDKSLFVCRNIHGQTQIEPFLASNSRAAKIRSYLDEDGLEQKTEISEMILRGDFDA